MNKATSSQRHDINDPTSTAYKTCVHLLVDLVIDTPAPPNPPTDPTTASPPSPKHTHSGSPLWSTTSAKRSRCGSPGGSNASFPQCRARSRAGFFFRARSCTSLVTPRWVLHCIFFVDCLMVRTRLAQPAFGLTWWEPTVSTQGRWVTAALSFFFTPGEWGLPPSYDRSIDVFITRDGGGTSLLASRDPLLIVERSFQKSGSKYIGDFMGKHTFEVCWVYEQWVRCASNTVTRMLLGTCRKHEY